MSAGLDTIALAVAHLERQREQEEASMAAERSKPSETTASAATVVGKTETVPTKPPQGDRSPRASPPLISASPATTIVPRHGFGHSTTAPRLVSSEYSAHPSHHIVMVQQHPPPNGMVPPHPSAAAAPRASPTTIYPVHRHHHHMHHQHPHHPSPSPPPHIHHPHQPMVHHHHPHHPPPHHHHAHHHAHHAAPTHYVYPAHHMQAVDSSGNPNGSPSPVPQQGQQQQQQQQAPQQPYPSPPSGPAVPPSSHPSMPAALQSAAPATAAPSPPPAAEEVVFDLDALDRMLSNAINMDISATTPPPECKEPIPAILPNDVLCGRGGETNHHAGNIRYRNLVKICQPAYIAAKRRDKPKIAQRIVRCVRLLGGRFLKKVPEDNCWQDVGNVKAREKTSQALREGAPDLRNGKDEAAPEKKKRKQQSSSNNTSQAPPPPKMQAVLHAHLTAAPSAPPTMVLPHPSYLAPGPPAPISAVSPPSNLMEVPPPTGMGSSVPYSLPQHPPQPQPTKRRLSTDSSLMPPTKVMKTSQPPLVSPQRASASNVKTNDVCFSATVSADDDDSSNGASSTSSPVAAATTKKTTGARGPRLKLLKKRWQTGA